jgi:phosphatidylglycerophosphate synthase
MNNPIIQQNIVEPPYFSNWADTFMPKIANKVLLPIILPLRFISPNMVTLISFFLYALSSIFLFLQFPYHLLWTTILLPISYILDCLDGQLARTRKQFSPVGDYLDKTLDVLKIYILTLSLGYAVYLQTQSIISIILGFTACFFFNYRYYIKLETVLSSVGKDPEYLQKCAAYRKNQYETRGAKYAELKKTFMGKLQVTWYWHRIIFFVDEAEFVVFTAVAALFNQLELLLWVFAISQTALAFFRLFERGYQMTAARDQLLRPMRK